MDWAGEWALLSLSTQAYVFITTPRKCWMKKRWQRPETQDEGSCKILSQANGMVSVLDLGWESEGGWIAQISAEQWGAAAKGGEGAPRVHGVFPLPMGIGREDRYEWTGLEPWKGSMASETPLKYGIL